MVTLVTFGVYLWFKVENFKFAKEPIWKIEYRVALEWCIMNKKREIDVLVFYNLLDSFFAYLNFKKTRKDSSVINYKKIQIKIVQ